MRWRAVGGTVLVGLFMTGCAGMGSQPSPVTSATTASGEVIATDWADYPAHAGMDGELRLQYADQTQLGPQAQDLITGIAAAIESSSSVPLLPLEPKIEWFSDDHWHPQTGNGYGGASMLTTVNCCELQSGTIPDQDEWQSVIDAASSEAVARGLGGFVFDQHTNDCNGKPGCWLWAATATDGVQWIYLTIQDAERDRTGEAAREAEKFGWPPASISLGYGATVVKAGSHDAYVKAMQPFIGQSRPPATTSD